MKRPRTPSFACDEDEYHRHPFGTPKRLRPRDGFDEKSPLLVMDLDPESKPANALDDWNALKELHALAMELYEGPNPLDALPLLRRVLRECERFLSIFRDPSVLYAPPSVYTPRTSPPLIIPPDALPTAEWNFDEPHSPPSALLLALEPAVDPSQPPEAVTAFYTVYGSALFSFGTLIAQDPSVIQSDEVPDPSYYYGRALDVFEVGENHPRRVKQEEAVAEDYRLALTCGRVLVHLAEERVSGQPQRPAPAFTDTMWPPDSPFSPQTFPFPPRRLSLPRIPPSDILSLAVDQLMRGFLHMPHTHRHPLPNSPNANFPRCRTLHTTGSDVLRVAAKLPRASDRKHWALWADRNVFGQMAFEAEAAQWSSQVSIARGKCCLLAAKASFSMLCSELESGSTATLDAAEVSDCVDHLNKAVQHLNRAASDVTHSEIAEAARSLLREAQEMLTRVPNVPAVRESEMDVS
ncbi:hypothetical protein AURDEDRAFT_115371 [Auricularia subglabra TFB-10046 SS5]|nr:hypothetical protein AURDEDRAFT_115371 [Auricularia subglabra TFB-10046 SS5]